MLTCKDLLHRNHAEDSNREGSASPRSTGHVGADQVQGKVVKDSSILSELFLGKGPLIKSLAFSCEYIPFTIFHLRIPFLWKPILPCLRLQKAHLSPHGAMNADLNYDTTHVSA